MKNFPVGHLSKHAFETSFVFLGYAEFTPMAGPQFCFYGFWVRSGPAAAAMGKPGSPAFHG